MIVTENITIDGRPFLRVYSDRGVKIFGAPPEGYYDEAVFPAGFTRTFTETDIPISEDTDADAEEIVDILTGEAE